MSKNGTEPKLAKNEILKTGEPLSAGTLLESLADPLSGTVSADGQPANKIPRDLYPG